MCFICTLNIKHSAVELNRYSVILYVFYINKSVIFYLCSIFQQQNGAQGALQRNKCKNIVISQQYCKSAVIQQEWIAAFLIMQEA